MRILLNKVVSEHSHTHSFIYCLWQLLHYKDEVELLPGPLQKTLAHP